MADPMPLSQTAKLPAWQRPEALLYLMAAAMPLSFATWSALLNNFVIEVASFTGREIGRLHTVREIPGLLAVAVIAILLAVREQVLALAMLALLGAATLATAWFASFTGLLVMTLLASGGLTIALVLFAALAYPQFRNPHVQHRHIVLRRGYGLYYALQVMAGARRQIFVVFAGFMLVERFGMQVSEMRLLLLINMAVAPAMGSALGRHGERNVMGFQYIGLTLVFLAYGGLYWFGWGLVIACGLYILDQLFFALSFSLKTYFQKIADPADIAPTAAVAFTINHVAAVFLPAALGYLWATSPDHVFVLGAGMALAAFGLICLIPRHPEAGNETVFARALAQPAE